MKINKCKLCGNNIELCKSHIIPEFFYEPIYEEGHIFYRFSSSDFPKKAHQGIYETLFCNNCESQFQKDEDYISLVWKSKEIQFYNKDSVTYFINLDYTRFKLFQLSIIWRASISAIPEFKGVHIGEKHESIIRNILKNRLVCKPYEYGCIIVRTNDPQVQQLIHGSIHIFPAEKDNGYKIYPMIFGSFLWLFHVSSHMHMFSHKNLFLTEEGNLPIVNDPNMIKRFLLQSARFINPGSTNFK